MISAQWYARYPRCGGLYVAPGISFHWDLRGGRLDGGRPVRRAVTAHLRSRSLVVRLWRHRAFCPHGYNKLFQAERICKECNP